MPNRENNPMICRVCRRGIDIPTRLHGCKRDDGCGGVQWDAGARVLSRENWNYSPKAAPRDELLLCADLRRGDWIFWIGYRDQVWRTSSGAPRDPPDCWQLFVFTPPELSDKKGNEHG